MLVTSSAMTRTRIFSVIVSGFVTTWTLSGVVALGQAPDPAPTTTSTPTTTTAPATITPPTAVAGPPKLSGLKLSSVVSLRQGHARFLVGIRTATSARVGVQVFAVSSGDLVKTIASPGADAPGRVYFMIEATNDKRFQLPAGKYRVRVQATDSKNRVSAPIEKVISLKLTAPRGRLDTYTVPLWPQFARSLKVPNQGGQLVVALAPKGDAIAGGIRRGDVILSIGGKQTLTTGSMGTALRGLKADTDTPIIVRRGTQQLTFGTTVKPDWNALPDFAAALTVLAKREPTQYAYAVARARYLIDTGKPADAEELISTWPKAWKTSAPGELIQAELQVALKQNKKALGAYNRAARKDPKLAEAQFGRGVTLDALGKNPEAAAAFQAAQAIDTGDPASPSFAAFSLVRATKPAEAVVAARAAVSLDPTYDNAQVAQGIALIASGSKAAGVKALRRGLILTNDPQRAQTVIDEYLEPNDP